MLSVLFPHKAKKKNVSVLFENIPRTPFWIWFKAARGCFSRQILTFSQIPARKMLNQCSQDWISELKFGCIVLLMKNSKEGWLSSICLPFDLSARLVNGYSQCLLIN